MRNRQSESSAGNSSFALDIKLREVRVDVLFDQLGQTLFATIVIAAIFACIQSTVVPAWQVLTWFTAILVVSSGRAILLILPRKYDGTQKTIDVWAFIFFFGVFVSGIAWGSTSLFLFPEDNIIHQAFIGFILSGMTAGAVSSFAASHRVFLAFMLPACVPYAVQLFLQGGDLQNAMGAMILVFIAVTWVTSKKTNATTTEALRLRFENLDLVERLGHLNENLQLEVAERERAEIKMKALVEEVTAATDAKSQFLANMSHEIRTPMNGVIGMADILSQSKLNGRQRHQVSLIQNSAQTLLALLNDILDFSRIEAGRIELEQASFDIREMVADAVDVLADQAEAKGLELACEVAEEIDIQVIGDQMRLRQILINLVGNAVKFTEKGFVVLRVTSQEGTRDGHKIIRFSVQDSGIGIDPKMRHRLFDPFKQADSSVARRFGGSGLGLSISTHLVELMDGTLDCASTVGEGSEFFFSVPMEAGEQLEPPENQCFSDYSQFRVLVAEENAVTIGILGNYLRSWHLDAVLERTGQDMIDTLEENARAGTPFAAVVVSASLFDMSGLELASRIRSSKLTRDTKVILLTPMNWSDDGQVAEGGNVSCTVNKPVRQSQLFDALHTIACRELVDSAESGVTDSEMSAGDELVDATFSCDVLLVEDNPVNQEVAAYYLQSFGCTLDIADCGAAALTASAAKNYDLIFMDCQMPGMDGFATTGHIRKREQSSDDARTPIIALTASAFAGDREECLAAGMDDYVSKPFAPSDLQAVLEKWLVGERSHECGPCATDVPTDRTKEADEALFIKSSHEHLDYKTLQGLRARSAGLLQRLIKLYQSHAPPLLEKVHKAEIQGDCVAIKLAAHALKSSSSNVAAKHLAELCQLLETKAQTGDIEVVRKICEEIYEEFDQVSRALDNEIATTAELV